MSLVHLLSCTPSGHLKRSWETSIGHDRCGVGAGMTFHGPRRLQKRIWTMVDNFRVTLTNSLVWERVCVFVCVCVDLKPQLRGISSFRRTSFRLPLGQYSVTMATLGTSTQPPTNLQRFGWSSSLQKHFCHTVFIISRNSVCPPVSFTWLVWLPVWWFWTKRTSWSESFWWPLSGHHWGKRHRITNDASGSAVPPDSNIWIKSNCNATVWTTCVLTRSQCKWRRSCGCLVAQCKCWVLSHSWCCCHCFRQVDCSWCYPCPLDLPDLIKKDEGVFLMNSRHIDPFWFIRLEFN